MILRFAVFTLLLLSTTAGAEIFKCERADGSIEFRATRCPIESSETEFTNTGIRTEHTRAATDKASMEDPDPETTARTEQKPALSAETGSALVNLCRDQAARLEKMKALGPTIEEGETMSPAEFDEFVKGFEAQVEESCAQYLETRQP